MADLATIDTAETANIGAVMHLNGPDGAPLYQDPVGDADPEPVTITLLGDDSDALIRMDRQNTNAVLRGSGPQAMTAELSEAKNINRLARATVGWSGIQVGGETIEWSEEAAKGLYRRFRWIRQQANQFVSDRANFSKASPTT